MIYRNVRKMDTIRSVSSKVRKLYVKTSVSWFNNVRKKLTTYGRLWVHLTDCILNQLTDLFVYTLQTFFRTFWGRSYKSSYGSYPVHLTDVTAYGPSEHTSYGRYLNVRTDLMWKTSYGRYCLRIFLITCYGPFGQRPYGRSDCPYGR